MGSNLIIGPLLMEIYPKELELGPILFLIMINDLELRSPHMTHWRYVDDVTISELVTTNEPSNPTLTKSNYGQRVMT